MKTADTIAFQLRLSPKFDLKPEFSEADAWFYEMVTGNSLTAELVALFMELNSSKVIDDHAWSTQREEVFLKILASYRDWIIHCPAVIWRSTVLRNIFREINLVCSNIGNLPIHYLERC